jgi:osmoprotectant transport system permease protein
MREALAYFTDHSGEVLQRLLEHIQLSGVALVIAVVVALPVALWLGHTGRGALVAINSSNIGRALPSLALIGLFVSLPPFGLSDRSTIAALVALAIPPIMTNTYTGLREVDREVVEAARGMGMSDAEMLRKVELPLAAPVILAGIRTAAVQVVATATLGAVIAGGGLGRLIVDGFASGDTGQVVTGGVTVALLAVATELGLGALERAVTPRGLAIARGARPAVGRGAAPEPAAEPATPTPKA